MNQSDLNQGELLARLDGLHHDIARLDKNVGRVFARLDGIADQGHEVRLQAIEKRMDGLWAKVLGVVAAVSSGVTLLWSLMKGAR